MKLQEKNNFWLWNYRYYKGADYALPKSVCPLFWKGLLGLILMVLSPLAVLFVFIFYIIDKIKDSEANSFLGMIRSTDLNGWRMFWGNTAIILGYYFLTMIGLLVLGYESSIDEVPEYLWFVAWLILPVFLASGGLVVYLILKSSDKLSDNGFNIPTYFSIPTEAIKAKINRACPTITWK